MPTYPSTSEALVTAFCGWHIAPSRTVTLRLDGSGARSILLPSLHVTDVASVSSDGVVLDPDRYDWSEAGIVELRGGCFTSRLRGVSVTFTHGYDTMPPEVQAVIGELDGSGIGPQPVQVGQVRVETSDGWTSAESILAPYKLPPRP